MLFVEFNLRHFICKKLHTILKETISFNKISRNEKWLLSSVIFSIRDVFLVINLIYFTSLEEVGRRFIYNEMFFY